MGNRISISFKNEDGLESPVLFSHWRGQDLLNSVRGYLEDLLDEVGNEHMLPIQRLEPGTVMVDFIRWLTEGNGRVSHDLYLGRTPKEGDNSDNGHYVIELFKSKGVFKIVKADE